MNKLLGYLLFLFLLFSSTLNGQIPNAQYVNAIDAANVIMGSGVTVTNANFIGSNKQIGKFWDGSKLGFTEGLALTTGDVKLIEQFGNSNSGQEIPVYTSIQNPDIAQAVNSSLGQVKSPATLEISFIPLGKEISFDFVFASDEYPEEVCCPFNDVALILLSGPGINGTYSNNSINIATTPNGNHPVSINSINNGNASSCRVYGTTYNCPPFSGNNTNQYISNTFSNTPGNALNEKNAQLAYDGLTKVLNAKYDSLECGKEYQIRFMIANLRDHFKDSGLFVKKNSFTSNAQVPGSIVSNLSEYCRDEEVTFSISNADPSYHYSWSTGQAGTGLSSVSMQLWYQSSISCTITTPDGCIFEQTFSFSIEDCCKNNLTFWSDVVTPYSMYLEANDPGNTPMTVAWEVFRVQFTNTPPNPIVEMRVNVTSFDLVSEYDECVSCDTTPFLMGSIDGPSLIGGATAKLHKQLAPYQNINSPAAINGNFREIRWTNNAGAYLIGNDVMEVQYFLPAKSELPCCADSARVCIRFTYIDINCEECTIFTCSTIPLKSAADNPPSTGLPALEIPWLED